MTDYKNRVHSPKPGWMWGAILNLIIAVLIIGGVIVLLGVMAERDEAVARAEQAEKKLAQVQPQSRPAETCRIFRGEFYCFRRYKGM